MINEMKKTILNIFTITALAAVTFSSCRKDILDRTSLYPALKPSNLDLTADTWNPVLVKDFSVLNVGAPDAVTSPAYVADLNEIKGLQKNLTSDQQSKIQYWSAGSVLRWNEILRELVAKHNIPPYQNPDGTYPAPSSTNPFNYPEFPFSNPPYAARAYAYVSAAQYDALIAAWHFKNVYKRTAPYKNDSGVKALIPASELPVPVKNKR